MTINNRENKKKLIEFSKQLVLHLKENPIVNLSESEIKETKYPDKKCQFCQQLGCDIKHTGFYVHNPCLKYVQQETFKFMRNVLNLNVKSK